MCKEMPVIPVNKVVDPKRIIGKKVSQNKIFKLENGVFYVLTAIIDIPWLDSISRTITPISAGRDDTTRPCAVGSV
jgi:hypothetical protein